MKVEKFKVLLYLKKSGLDKNGKAPIMGRITLNRTMAQFGCKLPCTPKLWNPRESRLDGKSKEAVEVNAKIDKLLLAINSAYESLVERKTDFDAKALTREDFLKIRDLEIPERRKSLALTRDLFLFACYTGTAYADTVSITEENIFRDEEGSLWLKYHRKKNKMLARVKLLPEALAMLKKYKDPTRPTLLPPQEFRVLRGNMKSLRVLSGISMDLVYHVGRHSFASLVTLEEGVPIETISRMLGHNNIQTTQIYARVTPKKLFEDMDKFIEANKDFKFVL
jgi:integrase